MGARRLSLRSWPSLLATGIVFVTFTWILFLPVSHAYILFTMFAMLGLLAVVALFARNPRIDWHMWAIAFLIATLGLYGVMLGNGNPAILTSIAIFLVTPALFLICAAVATELTLRSFIAAAATATIALTTVLLVFVAGEAGIIPQIVPDWAATHLELVATFRDNSTQARSWGLSSLAGLGPLWVASLLFGRHPLLPPWWLRLCCAVLSLATAVVSDRSAIVMVIAAALPIALLLRFVVLRDPAKPRKVRKLWVGVTVAGLVAFGLALPRLLTLGPVVSLVSSIGSFFGIAEASGDANQSIRSDQAWYLLQAWMRNPIFGAGLHASVPDYTRTSETPWTLELQYHLLLFEVGLVGMTLALAAVVVGLRYVRKAALANPSYLPLLVSAATCGIAMLVANATNPYLQAPGHQWAVYLPLAVATVALAVSNDRDSEPADSAPGSMVRDRSVANRDRTSGSTAVRIEE